MLIFSLKKQTFKKICRCLHFTSKNNLQKKMRNIIFKTKLFFNWSQAKMEFRSYRRF